MRRLVAVMLVCLVACSAPTIPDGPLPTTVRVSPRSATINVGAIQGGKQPNIVPDECAILIDRRTLPGETGSVGPVKASTVAGSLAGVALKARSAWTGRVSPGLTGPTVIFHGSALGERSSTT